MIRKLWIERSTSCRDFSQDEILFLFATLNNPGAWGDKWVGAKDRISSEWCVRLETQRYIDRVSELQGHSATYRHVTPKVTLFSLDDWCEVPHPKAAFQDLLAYRRFLILFECGRAMNLTATHFRDLKKTSVNNIMMYEAENTEWLHEKD